MTDINLTGKISAASMSGRLSNLYIPKDVTEYDGPTSITPSANQQQFDTAGKLVNENLVVEGARLDGLVATENGTYRPAGDAVGFGKVDVDVNPDLRPLSVSENGQYSPDGFDGYSSVTADIEPNLTSLSVTENGLYLPESGVDGFDRINVNVPQKWDINTLADRSVIFDDDFTLDTATSIKDNFFYGIAYNVKRFTALEAVDVGNGNFNGTWYKMEEVNLPKCEKIGSNAISNLSKLTKLYAPKLRETGENSLRGNPLLSDFDFSSLEIIGNATFADDVSLPNEIVMPNVTKIGSSAFIRLNGSRTYKFGKKATSIASNAFNLAGATDIYVPWSQGEVANAPWGATNATIHYNTVYDENWNVISST